MAENKNYRLGTISTGVYEHSVTVEGFTLNDVVPAYAEGEAEGVDSMALIIILNRLTGMDTDILVGGVVELHGTVDDAVNPAIYNPFVLSEELVATFALKAIEDGFWKKVEAEYRESLNALSASKASMEVSSDMVETFAWNFLTGTNTDTYSEWERVAMNLYDADEHTSRYEVVLLHNPSGRYFSCKVTHHVHNYEVEADTGEAVEVFPRKVETTIYTPAG